ncbi:serine protease [Jannaschia pagri]|uniref:Serine protease n=1 Tax=Jannaschia pagri TaxID=2829797 RepID=A0ABQ4NHE9_9RHOB|nr:MULTISPECIES: trypsin-like serine protease [unclassified Jannaschia]GIT90059.1 serine protease [Jannaschia sp. AI_61]GIT93835.1 serine protease [Jannaschia sp. AI_62]
MFMSVVRKVFIAAGLMCAGALPLAAQGTGLQTLSTADDNRGWEAVGRLNFGSEGFCTAALVTPDVVLTAAHCLYNKQTGERVEAADIEFQAGLRFGRAEAYRGIRRIVLHPDYDFAEANRLGRVGSDMALLELDRPVRNGHVHPFRTQFRVNAGQTVQVVSYAKDRAEAPTREEACQILTRDADILVLSCSVDFGSSGAPVFVSYNDEVRIVSVISAKAEWDGRPVALAAVMEGELDALIAEFARTPAFAPVGKTVSVETAADR